MFALMLVWEMEFIIYTSPFKMNVASGRERERLESWFINENMPTKGNSQLVLFLSTRSLSHIT